MSKTNPSIFTSFTFIFFLGFYQSLAFGQSAELRFNHLNSEDGLSDNRAKCFIQDKNGFIWIGTNNGLNRYDGHDFITFKTDSPGKSQICGNSISGLDIDRNGQIWIATEDNGFCSMNPENFEFFTYSNFKGDALEKNRMNDLICINENEIGLAVQHGYMATYFVKEDSLVKFEHETSKTVYEFARISENEFASVGLLGGIRIQKGDSLFSYVDSTNQRTHSLNAIEIDENNIYAGSWGNTICVFDRTNKQWKYHPLEKGLSENSSNIISEIAHLDSSRIIIGTDNNGLFIFDKRTQECHPVLKNERDVSAPRGISIHAIFKDRNSRVWIGSNSGIDIYDPLLNQFEITFLPQLNGAKIYDIVEHNNTVLFASTDGLLKSEKNNGTEVKNELLRKDLKFRCFTTSPDNRIYIGSNKALFELTTEPFGIKNLPKIELTTRTYVSLDNLSGSTFSDIFFVKEKEETWLCAMAYGLDLVIIDLENKTGYAYLPYHLQDGNFINEHLISNYFTDSQNKVWACSRNKGLIRIDHQFTKSALDSSVIEYKVSELGLKSYFYSEKDGMPSKNVFDIIEDFEGNFWLSSIGHGLIHFQPEADEKFEVIDLEYKTIHGLEIDKNGNLWGITSKGILYYNPKSKKHKLFNQIDGISLNGMVGNWYKNEKGELYKGLNGSYIKFQPEDIQFNAVTEPVYLTQIKINNTPIDSIVSEKKLKLDFDQNFVTFQFASPSYTNPKLNAYEYILEGVDPEWRTIQGKNEAVYTSLQAGSYPFKIRAANNDGHWSEYTTLVTLDINPPWYKTWWFYALIVLAISSILFALYKYRIAQLVKFYEMRNQIARDLHDDIGSTLGSISFYSEVAEQQLKKNGESNAEDVVQKIGSTSREMMESIGDIVWAVNPKNDTIEKMVERMKNFSVPLLASKAIQIHFEVDESLHSEKLGMENRKNLFLIFKECVHNALKYSKCTKMSIQLQKIGKEVHLKMDDNGIGFDMDNIQAYNGNGMINMRERAKEMSAELNIESALSKGTAINLKFELS